MRHLVYSTRYRVPINTSANHKQHTPRLEQHSFVTTQSIHSFHGVITEFECIYRNHNEYLSFPAHYLLAETRLFSSTYAFQTI